MGSHLAANRSPLAFVDSRASPPWRTQLREKSGRYRVPAPMAAGGHQCAMGFRAARAPRRMACPLLLAKMEQPEYRLVIRIHVVGIDQLPLVAADEAGIAHAHGRVFALDDGPHSLETDPIGKADFRPQVA